MVTGEKQAARIRNLYLKAIFRQEIGFFDKETNTGEVVGRMSGDTVLIQDAMGEKACIFHLSLISISFSLFSVSEGFGGSVSGGQVYPAGGDVCWGIRGCVYPGMAAHAGHDIHDPPSGRGARRHGHIHHEAVH